MKNKKQAPVIHFEIGDQVHILKQEGKNTTPVEALSRVREQTQAGLIVDMPEEAQMSLEIGEKLRLQIFRDGDCLEMKTRVIEKQAEDTPLLYLLKTRKIHLIQKRAYVRIDVMIPLNFSQIHIKDTTELAEVSSRPVDQTVYSGRIINISGGGMVISTIKNFHPGDHLRCNFTLEKIDVEIEKVIGKIVKCMEVEDEGFHIIVEFVGITDQERRQIIRYTFEEQRRLRIKGVI